VWIAFKVFRCSGNRNLGNHEIIRGTYSQGGVFQR
jgi:hypothetical protein